MSDEARLNSNQSDNKTPDSSWSSENTSQRPTSRIPGFAKLSSSDRLLALQARGLLNGPDLEILRNRSSLPEHFSDQFIENCIGSFSLPLGIATNFLIDGKEQLIPMAVEESSVVAAASHGAKLARSGGGFFTRPTETIATAQIQIKLSETSDSLKKPIHSKLDQITELASQLLREIHPRLIERGGGLREIEIRSLPKPGNYALHLHVDTREAMGANIVNTLAEKVASELPKMFDCAIGLKILTNLTIRRITRVRCRILPSALTIQNFEGQQAAESIVEAYEFAEMDPFRAATHNKGVMNGIDPVVIATGNDWRAVEAGCHAYAAFTGQYRPLTQWTMDATGALCGEIAAPIAVGTVGGVTRLHPAARVALKLLDFPPAGQLSGIIASVGLAQNLSALRALACEGIQKGHMALHERNLEMLRRHTCVD